VIQVHESKKGFHRVGSDLPKMLHHSQNMSKGSTSEKQLKPSFLHHNHNQNAYQMTHTKSRSKFNMLNLDVNIEQKIFRSSDRTFQEGFDKSQKVDNDIRMQNQLQSAS